MKGNHQSAIEHPTVISEALAKEVAQGRLKGPLAPNDYPFILVSSLGAVPKKHSSNKWRLILDLHPAGCSVNDGIDKVKRILALGPGSYSLGKN